MSEMREAENAAEAHMLLAWWLRILAMATGTTEDQMALLHNREARWASAKDEIAATAAWGLWYRQAQDVPS